MLRPGGPGDGQWEEPLFFSGWARSDDTGTRESEAIVVLLMYMLSVGCLSS